MTKVSNDKNVVAVVVTYNRKVLLKECINALLKLNTDILIIDNGSNDGTKDYISNELKNNKINYKNTGSNLGGAGGFNYGMKEAYNLGYKYIWLMDDDCIVNENTLEELLNADKELKGKYGFLASRVLWKDNSICRMNEPKVIKSKSFNNYLYTYQTSFVSFFIKREVIKDVGLPIKDFFIWGDDIEYSNRISKKYDNYTVITSTVIHKTKNNYGSNIALDNERIDRYKYAYRNEMYIARQNGLKGRIRQFLKINYHILKVLIYSKKKKKEKIKLIIKNSIEGNKFNPKVEGV